MSDEELEATLADDSWKRPFRLLFIGWLVLVAAVVGLIILRQSDNAAATARNAVATVQEDYTRCLAANESRAALRAIVEKVAPAQPVATLDEIPEDLRPLAIRQYQDNQAFRAQWLPKFAPRDCEAEREEAQQRRNGG